jgi:coenzyme F420 hydrogenase subunit beta
MNDSAKLPSGEMISVDNANEKKLCSLCGLCMVRAWPAKEGIEGCVFTLGWLGEQEMKVLGRERSSDNYDEMLFGISRERFVARMKNPLPTSQFTGIITNIAKKAFETGLVDAVVTLHRSQDDYLYPQPVLARSSEAILAGGGSKPVLASPLVSLEKVMQEGITKILVIGTPCHVHNFRQFKRRSTYLKDVEAYVVGIPCTDNSDPKKFRWVLSKISRSPETVRFIEFMQDFTVHLKHEDGRLERVPFFSLPQELSRTEIFPPSCRSCFDYMNSLSDITVGYLGAPLDVEKMYQWVVVRTGKGEKLWNLIADDLETCEETSEGDRTMGVQQYVHHLLERMSQDDNTQQTSGESMSLEEGFHLAEYLYSTGPRGLEFARYGIETHLIRNYYYVKSSYPDLLGTLVPKHTYHILKKYDLET